MFNVLKNRIYKIFKILILSLFLAYWAGISLFFHRHDINGKTIFHSHPYWPFSEKQPVNHQHSGDQLLTLGYLSMFLSLATTVIILLADRITFLKSNNGYFDQPFFLKQAKLAFLLRAPPRETIH